MKENIYKGNIVAGSLLTRESRIIARLLLNKVDSQSWYKAIVIDNMLQKLSPATAKRQSILIKERLALMKPELLSIIEQSSTDVATQALLSSAIKHN